MYQCSRVFAFIDFSLQIVKGGRKGGVYYFWEKLYDYWIVVHQMNGDTHKKIKQLLITKVNPSNV